MITHCKDFHVQVVMSSSGLINFGDNCGKPCYTNLEHLRGSQISRSNHIFKALRNITHHPIDNYISWGIILDYGYEDENHSTEFGKIVVSMVRYLPHGSQRLIHEITLKLQSACWWQYRALSSVGCIKKREKIEWNISIIWVSVHEHTCVSRIELKRWNRGDPTRPANRSEWVGWRMNPGWKKLHVAGREAAEREKKGILLWPRMISAASSLC